MKQRANSLLLAALAVVLIGVSGCQVESEPVSASTTDSSLTGITTEAPASSTERTDVSTTANSSGPTLDTPTAPTSINTSLVTTTPPTPSSPPVSASTITSSTPNGKPQIVPTEASTPPWTFPASVMQPVVAEIFTYDGCQYCPEVLGAVEGIAETYDRSQLIVLEYHIQGAKHTEETVKMYESYPLLRPPSVVLNGNGSRPLLGFRGRAEYTSKIGDLLSNTSTVMMNVTVTNGATMAVSVELVNLSTEALETARIYAVFYEDTGVSHNHYLVRDIKSGSPFTLAGRTVATYEIASGAAVPSDWHMVILLKSTSGEIVQSQFVK